MAGSTSKSLSIIVHFVPILLSACRLASRFVALGKGATHSAPADQAPRTVRKHSTPSPQNAKPPLWAAAFCGDGGLDPPSESVGLCESTVCRSF